MEKLAIGLMLGALGGALAVANSHKMQSLVKKGQEEVLSKVNTMMDEKLECMKQTKSKNS